jgi:hypothetical protein
MKEKKTKEKKAKSESISDREHDEKKDLSFLNLPTNARENAEGFGVYKEYNHNY